MLLHAAIHWPDVADPQLWPLAVQHAVWIYNHVPFVGTGLSPFDVWTKSRFPLRELHHLHVFGCPVYVLEKKLADGKSIGRWHARSQRCIYVGFSDSHSKTVPLVLNPATGSITPQWNVTVDDYFSTVASSFEDLPDFNDTEWRDLFGTKTYHIQPAWDDLDDPDPDLPSSGPSFTPQMTKSHSTQDRLFDNRPPISPSGGAPFSSPGGAPFSSTGGASPRPSPLLSPSSSSSPFQEESFDLEMEKKKSHPPVKLSPTYARILKDPPQAPPTPTPDQIRSHYPSVAPPTPSVSPTALKKLADHNNTGRSEPTLRFKRERKPPSILNYDALGGNIADSGGLSLDLNLPEMGFAFKAVFHDFPTLGDAENAFVPICQAFEEEISEMYNIEIEIYKASKKKDPDTLSFDAAMRDYPNIRAWLESALKEITQLESKQCWIEIRKCEIPKGAKLIPCTWVFRIKRNPAGDIIKFKGRICLRGDLMDSNEESFAPVCMWSSVRYFLIMAIILNWVTVSVDWNNAFIQAVLKTPMYMATPRGFSNKYGSDGCLKVLKSLYGSKFAPRNWYMHLRSALIDKLGMKECPQDKCLLYRKDLLLVLYVDDAGIAAPTRKHIDDFVQELRDLDFDLDIEDDFNSYLGIGIEPFPDGSRHMTQSGLIKKILKTTQLENCKPNNTPARPLALGSDPDGELFDEHDFSYASVVGMLLYLSNNTRPDITFAVSQVARFTSSPKLSHAKAIKHIVRYLAGTIHKGLIVKPDGTFNIRTWVDADFSGIYGQEPEDNPKSAQSRFGYIITFAGMPLVWKSKIIDEICLSTLHAEYVGLTHAVKAMIPIRDMIAFVLEHLNLPTESPEIHCSVFEDNQGAYLLATNQRISPRTKYFNVKYHFSSGNMYLIQSRILTDGS